MKRHPALYPLSHDHQNALARALRLRRARDGDPQLRSAECRSFVEFARTRLEPHFADEEQLVDRAVALAPELDDLADARARLFGDHARLREGVLKLHDADDAPAGDELYLLGVLLTEHVRFEERDLFELLQREFGDRLDDLVEDPAT